MKCGCGRCWCGGGGIWWGLSAGVDTVGGQLSVSGGWWGNCLLRAVRVVGVV